LGVGPDQAKQLYLRYGSTLSGLVAEKLIPAAAAAGFDLAVHHPDCVPAPKYDPSARPAIRQILGCAQVVAVVSAAPERHVRRCMSALQIDDLLPMVIGSEALNNQPKSDKATWTRAAELAFGRSLRDTDQVVVLDDHFDNLSAAAAAGFIPILVSRLQTLRAAAEALQQLSASPSDPVESTRRPTKSAHGTIAFFPDVTGRHSMVAAALKWAPMAGPDPEPLDTSTIGRFMTRAVCIDFLVGPKEWRQLLYTPVRVRSNRIIQVGNSSIVRESVIVGPNGPILAVRFTTTHVGSTGLKSEPIPADAIQALLGGGAVRVGARPTLSSRAPADAFRWCNTARWTEVDSNEHVNQMHYGVWMEEARCEAAAQNAFGTGEVAAAAKAVPVQIEIEYRGQAVAGDAVAVLVWWDGAAFCFEVVRDTGREGRPEGEELLTTGCMKVATESGKQSKL